MNRLEAAVLLSFFVASVVSCEERGNPPGETDDGATPRLSGELPMIALDKPDDCTGREPLSACDWLNGAEAVFFGEIKSVALRKENPCIYSDGQWVIDSNGRCHDIAPSLVFRVFVERTVSGALESGTEVDLAIAASQYSAWSPTPVDGDEEIVWVENGPTSGSPIAVGDIVGFAAYRASEGEWATLGEPLFLEGNGGQVEFQSFGGASCTFEAPTGLSQISVQEMAQEASTCSVSAVANNYRQAVSGKLQGNGACMSYAYGPVCRHSDDVDSRCTGDESCANGTVCTEGVCSDP